MHQAYLIFRSVTGGQRAKALLEGSGIPCELHRSPRQLSEHGCAYALTLSERSLPAALRMLRRDRIEPVGVYLRRIDGTYERASE